MISAGCRRRTVAQSPFATSANSPRNASGATLVELMVSMAVGAVSIVTAITVFGHSVKSSQFHEAASVMDESTRVAIQVLSDEIRMSGYTGVALQPNTINYSPLFDRYRCEKLTWSAQNLSIRGYRQADFVSPDCLAQENHIAGSDILVSWKASEQLTEIADVETNRVYLVSEFADDADTYVTTDAPSERISRGAWVNKFYPSIYFVRPCVNIDQGNSSICDSLDEAIPTLSRLVEHGARLVTEPLVPGVADMRFEFAIEGNTGAENSMYHFATSAEVVDWMEVIAVNVHLLFRSEKPVYAKSEVTKIQFVGDEIVKNDRFLWKSHSVMVALRNMPQNL